MKCQIIFPAKNTCIINLSSTDFVHSILSVNAYLIHLLKGLVLL